MICRVQGFPELGVPFWGSPRYELEYVGVYIGVVFQNYHIGEFCHMWLSQSGGGPRDLSDIWGSCGEYGDPYQGFHKDSLNLTTPIWIQLGDKVSSKIHSTNPQFRSPDSR